MSWRSRCHELKEVVPKIVRVAYLFDAANPGSLLAQKELEAAARALGVGLPAMHGARWFVDDGGLISYGASIPNNFRRVATYVDKILKGAKAPGLTIPPSVQLRADQVIE